MKRKVDQGETQRAYVHALSAVKKIKFKRLATTEISMRSALHTPFQIRRVFVFLDFFFEFSAALRHRRPCS